MKVYLAGCITGLRKEEANGWRDEITQVLSHTDGVKCISPLRCEPHVTGLYQLSYPDDPKFGTLKAIQSKNEYDVRNCDIIIAFLPKVHWQNVSYGTVAEIAMAYMLNKPVILVSDRPEIYGHPLIIGHVSWHVESLEEAVDIITGLIS